MAAITFGCTLTAKADSLIELGIHLLERIAMAGSASKAASLQSDK
jgi:hypothetical protein